MSNRIMLAGLLGALIALLWGVASWFLFPWHQPESFNNQAEVRAVILKNADKHGQYMLPLLKDQPMAGALKPGPFMYATVRPGQLDDWNLVKPIAQHFMVCFLLALILGVVMTKCVGYLAKLSAGIVLGLFAGITASLPHAIWMELPALETLARLADPLIAWTLAAAVMAAIVRRPKRRIFAS